MPGFRTLPFTIAATAACLAANPAAAQSETFIIDVSALADGPGSLNTMFDLATFVDLTFATTEVQNGMLTTEDEFVAGLWSGQINFVPAADTSITINSLTYTIDQTFVTSGPRFLFADLGGGPIIDNAQGDWTTSGGPISFGAATSADGQSTYLSWDTNDFAFTPFGFIPTIDTLRVNEISFTVTSPRIPAPTSAAVLALAGLSAARRRR